MTDPLKVKQIEWIDRRKQNTKTRSTRKVVKGKRIPNQKQIKESVRKNTKTTVVRTETRKELMMSETEKWRNVVKSPLLANLRSSAKNAVNECTLMVAVVKTFKIRVGRTGKLRRVQVVDRRMFTIRKNQGHRPVATNPLNLGVTSRKNLRKVSAVIAQPIEVATRSTPADPKMHPALQPKKTNPDRSRREKQITLSDRRMVMSPTEIIIARRERRMKTNITKETKIKSKLSMVIR
jgi:hypothetical protein